MSDYSLLSSSVEALDGKGRFEGWTLEQRVEHARGLVWRVLDRLSFAPHNHDPNNDFDYEMHYDCPACYEQPRDAGPLHPRTG